MGIIILTDTLVIKLHNNRDNVLVIFCVVETYNNMIFNSVLKLKFSASLWRSHEGDFV